MLRKEIDLTNEEASPVVNAIVLDINDIMEQLGINPDNCPIHSD